MIRCVGIFMNNLMNLAALKQYIDNTELACRPGITKLAVSHFKISCTGMFGGKKLSHWAVFCQTKIYQMLSSSTTYLFANEKFARLVFSSKSHCGKFTQVPPTTFPSIWYVINTMINYLFACNFHQSIHIVSYIIIDLDYS